MTNSVFAGGKDRGPLHHPGASPEPEFAAYISIDWADQKHDWAWQPSDGGPKRTGQFANTPEAIHAWVAL